jgi:hypothetical protein
MKEPCLCGATDCARCYPDLQHIVETGCGCGPVKACFSASCSYCGAVTCDNCETCQICAGHIELLNNERPDMAHDYGFRAGWVAAMVWTAKNGEGGK